MSRIFISYRRSDAAAEVGRIYDHLEKQFGRESIFVDVDAIDIGDNFRDRIQEAVGQCQILLAVMGKSWLHAEDAAGRRRLENPADWVRLEIETALNRNVLVIPVLLDGVEMPPPDDLPETLQPLTDRNAARVRHNPDFRRDMERVLDIIKRKLASSPESSIPLPTLTPEVLLARGIENYEEKRYEDAITDYDQVLRLNPNFTEAYNNRGNAKLALGDKQDAIADYDQAIRLNPNFTEAYNNRGNAKLALGDEQDAITNYDKAIRLNPNFTEAYFNRGFTKYALGDKQGAITDYDQAIRLNPNVVVSYNNRGAAKYALGDKQGAIADCDQALLLDPNHANAYYIRGLIKYDLGDKQGTVADLKRAARLYEQQGDTKSHRDTLDRLRKFE